MRGTMLSVVTPSQNFDSKDGPQTSLDVPEISRQPRMHLILDPLRSAAAHMQHWALYFFSGHFRETHPLASRLTGDMSCNLSCAQSGNLSRLCHSHDAHLAALLIKALPSPNGRRYESSPALQQDRDERLCTSNI